MTIKKDVTYEINGTQFSREIDGRSLLIEAIRSVGTKGSRVGCLTGDCGACTVVMDGRLTKSCLVLAVAADGARITTIEGAEGTQVAALQSAFVERKGFQCGYCTSGMIMVAAKFLSENPTPNDLEIREAISGNLCRCTGYDDIVGAISLAAERLNPDGPTKEPA